MHCDSNTCIYVYAYIYVCILKARRYIYSKYIYLLAGSASALHLGTLQGSRDLRGAKLYSQRQACSPHHTPPQQGSGARMPGPELGAGRGTPGSLSSCEQEETEPAAPQLWWEINQTNRPTIWISTLGEGARQQAQGQEGNAEAFYHLNNLPPARFHPNAHSSA